MKPSSIKHYSGRLGNFDYDTGEFEIWTKPVGYGLIDMLRYRGRETDGSKIEIPDGVVDASYMFAGSSVAIPPVLPYSVRITQYMFQNCGSLVQGVALPDGVTRTGFMYQNCRHLLAGSDLPDSVTDAAYMYDGCTALVTPGRISLNLVNATGMFRDCVSMRDLPELPETVSRCDNVFRGCDYLNNILD